MKIRTQLLGIIGIVAGALALSFGVYAVIGSSATRIERERAILDELAASLTDEAIYLDAFWYRTIVFTTSEYEPVAKRSDTAFAEISGMDYLKSRSARIAEALVQIGKMSAHQRERRASFYSALDNYLAQAEIVGGSRNQMRLVDFGTQKYFENKPGYDRFLEVATALSSSIQIMVQTCTNSVSIVTEQNAVIEEELGAIRTRSILLAILVGMAAGSIGIITAIRIARGISRRITRLESAAREIGGGELGKPVLIPGKDEIGELGRILEDMRIGLARSMGGIRDAADEAVTSKNRLDGSVRDSSGALSAIRGQADRIGEASKKLETSAVQSRSAVDAITGLLETVTGMIHSQAAMVEESTASVTQMASSLNSLSAVMGRNKDGAIALVRAAETGGERQQETNAIIEGINAHIETIQDMANLINGIASQTNLLAMNAAIEAAHAGDSGRGFAVVADEIRKLAEASAQNSKTIKANLNSVVASIRQATESSARSSDTFSEIQEGVTRVSNTFDESLNAITELKEGGNQVMKAMIELNDFTTGVTGKTGAIHDETSLVSRAVSDVSDATARVSESVADMKTALVSIEGSFAQVGAGSRAVGAISERLAAELEKYRLEAGDA